MKNWGHSWTEFDTGSGMSAGTFQKWNFVVNSFVNYGEVIKNKWNDTVESDIAIYYSE